jgi:GNAT superfamily N-acetyltransferase
LIEFRFIKNENIYSIIPLLQVLNKKVSEEVLKTRLDEMIKQKYKCIGIFDDKQLVGICGIWILTKYYVGKHIEPDNIVLLPEYRNKNIGKDLMTWIYKYAIENDCKASELNCYIHNTKAHKFFEKEGYKIIASHFQKKFENI